MNVDCTLAHNSSRIFVFYQFHRFSSHTLHIFRANQTCSTHITGSISLSATHLKIHTLSFSRYTDSSAWKYYLSTFTAIWNTGKTLRFHFPYRNNDICTALQMGEIWVKSRQRKLNRNRKWVKDTRPHSAVSILSPMQILKTKETMTNWDTSCSYLYSGCDEVKDCHLNLFHCRCHWKMEFHDFWL